MGEGKPVRCLEKAGRVMAIIARPGEINAPLNFLTPENFPLQLGVHNRAKGSKIEAHQHVPFPKLENLEVQEMFYVLEGEMLVSLFDAENRLFKKVSVGKGEIILINCGHGVAFTDDCKFFEVKQGPYRGNEGEKKHIGGKE